MKTLKNIIALFVLLVCAASCWDFCDYPSLETIHCQLRIHYVDTEGNNKLDRYIKDNIETPAHSGMAHEYVYNRASVDKEYRNENDTTTYKITPDDNNIECFIANEKQNGFLFIVGHSQYPENGNISSTMRFDIAIPDIYGDISPRSYQTEWELPETNKKNSIAYGRCIVVDDGNGPVQIDSEDNLITVVVDTVTGASHILKE